MKLNDLLKKYLPRIVMAVLLAFICSVSIAQTERVEQAPEEFEDVGVTEHLGDTLPLDLEFQDSEGNTVKLVDYFDGDRPVILTLVYFSCPMLCTLILNGLNEGMREMSWKVGQEFDVVTVSFDPRETYRTAEVKRQNYIKDYGDPSAASGWHFLTGSEENIKVLTDAIGFHYKFDEETQEFIHVATIFVISPDGMISRYLYGVEYDAQTLKFALLEAQKDEIGLSDRILLYCFHYDSAKGKYAPVAVNIMKVGGVFTLAFIALFLGFLWIRKPLTAKSDDGKKENDNRSAN